MSGGVMQSQHPYGDNQLFKIGKYVKFSYGKLLGQRFDLDPLYRDVY